MTPANKKALVAKAHHLKPVVLTGTKGLTSAVISEIEEALEIHELIKVRLSGDKEERSTMSQGILDKIVNCHLLKSIGHIVILYKAKSKR